MEKVRFGIIGSGGIARGAHIPQLQSHGKAEIAWCADVSEAAARETAERFGIPSYGTDYVKLLREQPVDAVNIATPHNAHFATVMAAIEAGVHVCCEKPLAMNVAEAEEMTRAAGARGIITFVPFSYWFVPAARLLKELINAGELGEILHVTGYYGQGNALSPRGVLSWRFQKEIAGSGALGDLGSHLISLTHLWAGPIKRLTAQTKTFVHERRVPGSETEMGKVDVDDDVQIIGELASGGLINLSASRTYTGRGNYQRVEVSGRDGGAVYDNSKPDELQVCVGKAWRERGAWATMQVGRQHRMTQHHVLVDAILSGKRPEEVLPNFRIGLEVQRVMDAALESAESGKWVELHY